VRSYFSRVVLVWKSADDAAAQSESRKIVMDRVSPGRRYDADNFSSVLIVSLMGTLALFPFHLWSANSAKKNLNLDESPTHKMPPT
jgi:hypothetical protein